MKKFIFMFWTVGLVLLVAVGLSARNLDTKGKAWLDAHNDPASINVNGTWYAKDWGRIVLDQAQGGRDLSGHGDGWAITGVVSGNQVFLLFSNKGNVEYSAELTSESDGSLNGSYSRGFMGDKSKGKSMHLTKQ